jgi:lipopolysaccharide transport system ATP-binding protein
VSAEVVVGVNGIGKAYQIYRQPQDRLKQFVWPRLQRMIGIPARNYYREFWAVRNMTFQLRRGETVGIIGRNGSGKSTLLQLICGTLTPTEGTVEVQGRVAALLELGSGFNPEFTGRENVFLNAAILGLRPSQIKDKYDEIVAFADIGDFIEQPVKTYSSGMMVRLAFAVIEHVDADLLVIDEALSVGDAIFTHKCMRWLRSFQKRGSLLFVSHDTASVQGLCDRAIWLDQGACRMQGAAKDVTEAYLKYTFQQMGGEAIELREQGGKRETVSDDAPAVSYQALISAQPNVADARGWNTGHAEVVSVCLENLSSPDTRHFEGGEIVRVRIRAKAHVAIDRPIVGFLVRDRLGQDLFGENTLPVTTLAPKPIPAGGSAEAMFQFRLPHLPNGHYELMASIAEGDLYNHVQHHWLHDAVLVHVSSSNVRYGLVGLSFQHVDIRVVDGQ